VHPLPAGYEDWERSVLRSERADTLWRVQAYRLGRFLGSRTRGDLRGLYTLPLGRPLVSQLWRAVGSIPANLAEGYSRGTGADRGRFCEYALGSTRECVVWYEQLREILDDRLINERIELLVQVKRLLIASLPSTRAERIRR
jgi:four helix bundle protein